MAATVFKGVYAFNTVKGKFCYLYFEGDVALYNLYNAVSGGIYLQATCVHARIRDAGGTYYTAECTLPINLKQSGGQIKTGLSPVSTYASLVDINTPNIEMRISDNYSYNTLSANSFICSMLCIRKDTNNTYYYNLFSCRTDEPGYTCALAAPHPDTFGMATVIPTEWSPYLNVRMNTEVPAAIVPYLSGNKPFMPTNDPYAPGDTTDKAGGAGDFDATSDPVDIPPLPTISVTDTGFLTLFRPSLTNIRDLAAYMWANPLFDVNAYKKILANPMDAILGLSIVPCAIPANTVKNVTVGNIPTGVSMPVCDSQYLSIDCGSINVNEYWGAYLDYSPYTKAELYLPYCGIHPIDIDDIMGKTVNVVYHVDILTGACVAYVKCGNSVLYSYIGQCASSIPVSGSDWTNMINGIINASTAIGSMSATGGLTAPMAASTIATTAVNTIKPSIERSGSLSGTGGIMGNQVPYLILTRPRQAMPEFQNKFIGYPSFITSYLGDLSGYTEVESIHLEEIPATEAELREIESLLKGGVLL